MTKTQTDLAIDNLARTHGVDRFTAAEMLPHETIAIQKAQAEWLENLPDLKETAAAAYSESFSKGGKNARKRAIRAARSVWAGFQ